MKIVKWEELPSLELYMDQVIIYVNEQLEDHSIGDNKVTSAMVNNYVKAKLMPKPVKKKYGKVHLAYIIAISVLKQIIPINEIGNVVQFGEDQLGAKQAYNLFIEQINYESNHVEKKISESFPQDNTSEAIKHLTSAYVHKMVALKMIEAQKEGNNG